MEDGFDQDLINELAYKWLHGTITEEEKSIYNKWTKSFDYSILELPEDYPKDPIAIREHIHTNLMRVVKMNKPQKKILPLWAKLTAIASVVVVFILATLWFKVNKKQNLITKKQASEIEINVPPGGDKAILTLANGKKISLGDAAQGVLANQSGIMISKSSDGQIIYKISDKQALSTSQNTIETPMGGQYRVILPDGTKVWLNAASKLTYSLSLATDRLRAVSLNGEAYFQVVKNLSHPFIVKSNTQEVKVLGTHFNINSYADEGKIITTLEEGSVKVTTAGKNEIIKPGQQVSNNMQGRLEVQNADLETSLAWKNNEMAFKDATVQEVMRQISRWYNIEIEYSGVPPRDLITGTISRKSNLSSVLEMFNAMKLQISLQESAIGKKLVVKHK